MKAQTFIKYPETGSENILQHIPLCELFHNLHFIFANGIVEEYEDEWGNTGRAGSMDSLFLRLQEIYNHPDENLLAEIEDFLLRFLLEYHVLSNGLPPTSDDYNILVRRLKDENGFFTNPTMGPSSGLSYESLLDISRSGNFRLNNFQRIIIERLKQIRDLVLEENGFESPISNIKVQQADNKPIFTNTVKLNDQMTDETVTLKRGKYFVYRTPVDSSNGTAFITDSNDPYWNASSANTAYFDFPYETHQVVVEGKIKYNHIPQTLDTAFSEGDYIMKQLGNILQDFDPDYPDAHLKVAIGILDFQYSECIRTGYARIDEFMNYIQESLTRNQSGMGYTASLIQFWIDKKLKEINLIIGQLHSYGNQEIKTGVNNEVFSTQQKSIPQIKDSTSFFLLIHTLGRMGIVGKKIPLNGKIDIGIKTVIEDVYNWAIEKFAPTVEFKLDTMIRYQTKSGISDKEGAKKAGNGIYRDRNRSNVAEFLSFHYPDKVRDITSILDEIVKE